MLKTILKKGGRFVAKMVLLPKLLFGFSFKNTPPPPPPVSTFQVERQLKRYERDMIRLKILRENKQACLKNLDNQNLEYFISSCNLIEINRLIYQTELELSTQRLIYGVLLESYKKTALLGKMHKTEALFNEYWSQKYDIVTKKSKIWSLKCDLVCQLESLQQSINAIEQRLQSG